jgi:hypothetical protein
VVKTIESAVHDEQIKELMRRVSMLEEDSKTNLAFRSKVLAWSLAASMAASFLAFAVNLYLKV